MRATNSFKFIPVTIDELMFSFCLNEKRKECEAIWKKSTKALLANSITKISDDEVYSFVEKTIDSMSRMVGEVNSEFSRFRNQQNFVYLKLLETAGANPEQRSSLLLGTDID